MSTTMSEFKEKPACEVKRAPVPEIVLCHNCNSQCEIWSDEEEVSCPSCGNILKK